MSSTIELFEEFKTNAENVGATVLRAANFNQAQQLLKGYLQEQNAKTVIKISSPLVDGLNLEKLQEEGAIEIIPEVNREVSFSSDVGICEVNLGVAETGSVFQMCTDLYTRYVSTLPPISVLVVNTNKMVETIPQALEYLYKKTDGNIPGYSGFITGPSRTADIERVLTIGVHGPAKLLLLVIDGE